jgi:transposase
MAKRKAKPKPRRPRRSYSEEFKQEAVQLVLEQQMTVAEAARNLGIHPNLLRKWKQQFETEQDDAGVTEDERMELARLRTENRRLRMERDILKKAAAFFANEKN